MSEQGPPNWAPPAPPPPQPWQQPPPYGAPPHQAAGCYGHGYPQPRDTNGFAIASLVGIFVLILGPLPGIIFGSIALKQIPRLGQRGRGLALAGIIIGALVLFFDVVGLIAIATDSTTGGSVVVNV